ncbi:uncharacterized protein LOC126905994 [Daktulosphaira vitifoliae]|uniref:uncharacterized protein LOC126905994 n=1 Tax=Daktulosphaira vitifoliae TaxID=58002 RepID=UPI0021A9C479|nr:uncharacterized protein LOC126905994 [Daktulosphaira vitifoliae]
MALILNIQMYFCIFFIIFHAEGKYNTKKNVIIMKYFLRYPGWKNINDVEYIKYWNHEYKFEDVFDKPITSDNCDNFIRYATIFLGCSYANDLTIMFFSLINFQKHCTMLLNSGNSLDSAYNCTVELLAKTIDIVPLAKLMKSALDSIENYHNFPWTNQKQFRYILCEVLTYLQKTGPLIELVPLIINSDAIDAALLIIKRFLLVRREELERDKIHCQLKSTDLISMWHLWNNEFDTLKTQGKYQEFFMFLNDKISSLVQTTYQKKYVDLGFIFDSNTNRTFLPIPTVNLAQNHKNQSINLVKQTNDVDVMEVIKQQDFSQNPSINLVKQNNEVDVVEEMLQEYMAQYSSIDLIQNNNEVNYLDEMLQEYIAKYSSINSNSITMT